MCVRMSEGRSEEGFGEGRICMGEGWDGIGCTLVGWSSFLGNVVSMFLSLRCICIRLVRAICLCRHECFVCLCEYAKYYKFPFA